MNWTEPKPPTNGISYYDHTILETPLGEFRIEWKSWKKFDSFSILLNQMEYIGEGNSLEDAKSKVKDYIMEKYQKLSELLRFL